MPDLKIKTIQITIGKIISEFNRHKDSLKELRDKHFKEANDAMKKYKFQWQQDECYSEQDYLRWKYDQESKRKNNLFIAQLKTLQNNYNFKNLVDFDTQLMEILSKLSFIEISALLFVLDPDQQAIALTYLNEQVNTAIITADEYKQLNTLKTYNPSEHSENNERWQLFCSNKIAPYKQQEAEKQKQEKEARLLQERQQREAVEKARKAVFDQRVLAETTLKNKLFQVMEQAKGKEWKASGIPNFFRNYSYDQYRPLQQWRPNTIVMIEKLLDEESKKIEGYTDYSKIQKKMIHALEHVTKQPHSFWNSFFVGRSNDTVQEYENIVELLR